MPKIDVTSAPARKGSSYPPPYDAPCAERVDYQRFFAMRVPCTYVRCLRDAAVPPERAAEYAARLGVAPIDMDCAHGPMLDKARNALHNPVTLPVVCSLTLLRS